eukprot:s1761_g15.t1
MEARTCGSRDPTLATTEAFQPSEYGDEKEWREHFFYLLKRLAMMLLVLNALAAALQPDLPLQAGCRREFENEPDDPDEPVYLRVGVKNCGGNDSNLIFKHGQGDVQAEICLFEPEHQLNFSRKPL